MVRTLFFLFFLFLSEAQVKAASDTSVIAEPSHLRISLIIGGPGEESWSAFGHSSIRIVDSSKTGAEHDKVYNFGVFESYPKSIMQQFLTEKVKVSLDTFTFPAVLVEYTETKRSLTEYVLALDDAQKTAIYNYLRNNLSYKNRYYYYDTFFDNCSTRIRDLFEQVFGARFVAAKTIPVGERPTFRNESFNKFCPEQNKYWFMTGLNLVFAGPIDRQMNDRDAMCLPQYLVKGVAHATIDGKSIYGGEQLIMSERIGWGSAWNAPFIFSATIALVTVAILTRSRSRLLRNSISIVVLALAGAIGCFVLYTMSMDGEPSWKNNLNLLWAQPLNILIPFMPVTIRKRYLLVAMILLASSIVVSVLNIQYIPLFEMGPLMLAMLWIYASIYRNSIRVS